MSYAREDEERARDLATALDQHGFSVFWDREVPLGETWHSHIGQALVNARCVVVAWSRHSIVSDWVIEEANEGKRRRILVPILFEAVQPPFGFGGIQAASLIDWRPSQPSPAFDGLHRAVKRIVGGRAGSGTEAVVDEPGSGAVQPSDGWARGWSRRTAVAMVVGLVGLAGAGGIVWWLTQAKPTGPTAGLPAPGASIAEPKPSEPSGDTAASAAPEQPSATSTATGDSREAMRDCPECPEMVLVPAGEFMMGSPRGEPEPSDDEGPQRKVTIAAPFWVGKYEVTFAEWDACVAAGGCSAEPGDGGYGRDANADDAGWGRDNRPVINVSWHDAKEYAGWLSQKTGKTYRLLSAAEWEYAARAGSTTAFWWGQDVGKGNANCDGCGSVWDNIKTARVGSFSPNDFGLYDTAGNVGEWVEDCSHDSDGDAPTDGFPWLEGDCNYRDIRGGSWASYPWGVRSAYHNGHLADDWERISGFRVARAPD